MMRLSFSQIFACLLIAFSPSLAFDARADAAAGEKVFNRYCSVCHSLASGRNKYGPSLSSVVGRKSASIGKFEYSDAFRALNVVWDVKTLDIYLAAPGKMAPGTKMTFPGLPDAEDRKNLIEFLATVQD